MFLMRQAFAVKLNCSVLSHSFLTHTYLPLAIHVHLFHVLLLWARDIAQESPLLDNFTMELETPRSQLKGKRTLLVERELSAFLQGRSNTKILSSPAHPPSPRINSWSLKELRFGPPASLSMVVIGQAGYWSEAPGGASCHLPSPSLLNSLMQRQFLVMLGWYFWTIRF